MNKQEFISALREKLIGLPQKEVEERLSFYSEMIDDRMEDGCLEEDAVAAIGGVDAVAAQIVEDIPLMVIIKDKLKSRRKLRIWEIVLLALGSPIWISLLVAAFAVFFAFEVSIISVLFAAVVAVWAVFVALTVYAPVAFVGGIIYVCNGFPLYGLIMLSAGLVGVGLAILAFFGAIWTLKGCWWFLRKNVVFVKICFRRKERKK